MTTLNLATDVQFGVSPYTGQRSVRYAACPHCGSDIHRYPRMAWPHGHRLYGKCAGGCGFGLWEHEETELILAALGVGERARQLTTVSGYWLDNVAVTDPRSEPCPVCNDTQDDCPVCPPADDAVYLRAWRDGAFDDDLEGFAEADFYTLTETVMSGE